MCKVDVGGYCQLFYDMHMVDGIMVAEIWTAHLYETISDLIFKCQEELTLLRRKYEFPKSL